MLREYNNVFTGIHKAWDLFLTAAAFTGAYLLKKFYLPVELQGLSSEPNYYILLLGVIIIWHLVFRSVGFHTAYRQQTFNQIAIQVFKALSISLLCLVFFIFILKISGISRLFIGIFIALNFFLLLFSKWLLYKLLTYLRVKGFNSKYVLIVGCNQRVEEILDSLDHRSESGYRVLGCLTTDEAHIDCGATDKVRVLGTVYDFDDVVTRYVVDELIFADPLWKVENALELIYDAELRGISVHILPEWGLKQIGFQPHIGALQFMEFFGTPTLTIVTTQSNNPFIVVKYIFDYLIAGIGLLICFIPFLFIALAIKLSSPGPVFFKQERMGLNGRRFRLYKFRTMIEDAEQRRQELTALNESDGPVFKIRNDPRIIPYIGTFLRKTSLDELPQLINIIRGEMSFVGPRPPLPDEVDVYDIWQRRRLSMKPGLTCLWQIASNRNEVRFNEWVNMDLKYIDNWSLGLDFRVLCKTAVVVLMGYGR